MAEEKYMRSVRALAELVSMCIRSTKDDFGGLNMDTLRGACAAASYTLMQAINIGGYARAEFAANLDYDGDGHAWTIVNERYVIDLTFRQFQPDAKYVHVVPIFSRQYDKYLRIVTFGVKREDIEATTFYGERAIQKTRRFMLGPLAFKKINKTIGTLFSL